ncbi:MAG TPA: lytic transglycosylase domain-containing protein [Thermoanaerobaculia bacterium]|jgi:membrane-bound lytic murein transglycosylase D
MKTLASILLLLSLTACATSAPSSQPRPQSQAPQQQTERWQLANLPHERVDYWVERFSNGDKRAEMESYFARMPRYQTMIVEKLRRKRMPEELLYLAMVESGFNTEAHSAQAARGIWQLVPDTARRYGLKVDDTVDERIDPEKSTDAALSYLSYLYNRFGSWYVAAAAYNAGENRVGRIMTEATGAEKGTDADYYRIWQQLPAETRDYVPAMIAAARIGKSGGLAPAVSR